MGAGGQRKEEEEDEGQNVGEMDSKDDWCMKVNEERDVCSPVMLFLTKRY